MGSGGISREAASPRLIDPLFEHRCQVITNPAIAALPRIDQQRRFRDLEAFYQAGVDYLNKGRAQDALPALLTYLGNLRLVVANTHHLYHDALLLVATVRSALKDYPQALLDAEEVVRIRQSCFGDGDRFTLEAMSVKAMILNQAGRARDALLVSIKIRDAVQNTVAQLPSGSKPPPAVVKYLLIANSNVAAGAHREFDTVTAIDGALRTIEGASELPSDDPNRYELINSSWYIVNRAIQRRGSGDPAASIAGLQASYDAMSDLLGAEHPRTAPLLSNLGFAVADQSPCDGQMILDKYVALIERERLRFRRPNDRQMLFEGGANAVQRAAFAARDCGRVLDVFIGHERSKARALRDSMSIRLSLSSGALPTQEARALGDLEQTLSTLEAEVEAAIDTQSRLATSRVLEVTKADYTRQFARVEAAYPKFRLAAQSSVQGPENVASVLKPDEVFVSYLGHRVDGPVRALMVAVLEPSGRLTVVSLSRSIGLEQTADTFAEILSRAGGLQDIGAEGRDLFRRDDHFMLSASDRPPHGTAFVGSVEELRDHLSGELLPDAVVALLQPYKRWIVSPAGPLWSIPFEALREKGSLVLDNHIVRYVHSWTMLSLLSEAHPVPSGRRLPMLAVGGASYSDRRVPSGASDNDFPVWNDLPNSIREIDKTADEFALEEGVTVFRGPSAVRTTVIDLDRRGVLAQADSILFSGHGYLDPVNPARSALVLGRPPQGSERDRYFSARDISQLTLNADLVVVSSCVSGTGRVAAGEGMLGLPYAFFSAGAKRALLTRWKIYDDPATSELVGEFLSAAAKGMEIDEALTEAKRRLRLIRSEAFWAPFILIGR